MKDPKFPKLPEGFKLTPPQDKFPSLPEGFSVAANTKPVSSDFVNKITTLNKSKINPSKSDQIETITSELSQNIAKQYGLDESDAREFVKINAQKDYQLSGYDLKTDIDEEAKNENVTFDQKVLQQAAPQPDAVGVNPPLVLDQEALLKANGFKSFQDLYANAEEVKLGPGLEGAGFNLDEEVEQFKNRKGRGQAALDAFQQSTKDLAYGLGDFLVESRKVGLDITSKLGSLTPEEIEKKRKENVELQQDITDAREENRLENENNEYEQYFTNKIASAVPSFVPMVAGAAVSRVAPQAGANIMQVGFGMLGGSEAGSAMREYEEYQKSKGREVDEFDKWSAGVGSAGVEYITERLPMSKFLGKNVRKNLANGTLKQRIKLNPQDNADLGKDILKSYAKKQPAKYKKLLSELKDVQKEGASEAIAETLQLAISNYYKDNEDKIKGSQVVQNAAEAFAIGSAMRAGISPLSYNNQERAVNQRRKAQGGVVLTEYKGEAVEVISRNKKDGKLEYTAMYPDGEIVEVDAENTGELFKLSNDQFDNLLRAKEDEKSAYEAIRTEQQFNTKTQIDQKFATDEGLNVNQEGKEVFIEGRIRIPNTDNYRPVTILNTNGNKATIRYEDNGEKSFADVRDLDNVQEFTRDDFYKMFEVDYIPNTPFKSPSAGEKVVHPTFGEGRVISYDPNNGNATAQFTDNSDPSDPQPITETDIDRATIDKYRGLYDQLRSVEKVENPVESEDAQQQEVDPFNDDGTIDLNQNEPSSQEAKTDTQEEIQNEVEPGNSEQEINDAQSVNQGANELSQESSPNIDEDVSTKSDSATQISEEETSGQNQAKPNDGSLDNTDSIVVPESTRNTGKDIQQQGWVVKKKDTGEVVMELNKDQRNLAEALDPQKVELIPIGEYLSNLNNKQNETKNKQNQEESGEANEKVSTKEASQKEVLDESDTTTQSQDNEVQEKSDSRPSNESDGGVEKSEKQSDKNRVVSKAAKKAEPTVQQNTGRATSSSSTKKVSPKQEQTNELLDRFDAYNKLPKREKSAEEANFIKVLANDLGYKVKGSQDLSFDGTKPKRKNAVTATSKVEDFTPLKNRSKKTQRFVNAIIETNKNTPKDYNPFQGMKGISVPTNGINAFIKDLTSGKNTVRAKEFLDQIDDFVKGESVTLTIGSGYYQQETEVSLDEVIESFEQVAKQKESKPEKVLEELPFQKVLKKVTKLRPDLKGSTPQNLASNYVNPWTKKNKAEIEKAAQQEINKLGSNKPQLEVYESDLDLIANYPSLVNQIGINDVAGAFHVKDGVPKIMIVASNPKFRNSKGEINSREVQDTLIHEMVGHYGLRGSVEALGGDKIELFKVLDSAKSGMKTSRLNEITRKYTNGQFNDFKDIDTTNPDHYKILEEYIAHEVQLNNIDGSPKRNQAVKKVLDYLKGLLDKLGFNLKDRQLREAINNAKKFVEVGENNFVPRPKKSIDNSEIETLKQLGELPPDFQKRSKKTLNKKKVKQEKRKINPKVSKPRSVKITFLKPSEIGEKKVSLSNVFEGVSDNDKVRAIKAQELLKDKYKEYLKISKCFHK